MHPGDVFDDAAERLVGLTDVRHRHHAHAAAPRRLREQHRKPPTPCDESNPLHDP
jgi:hypothetical protein